MSNPVRPRRALRPPPRDARARASRATHPRVPPHVSSPHRLRRLGPALRARRPLTFTPRPSLPPPDPTPQNDDEDPTEKFSLEFETKKVCELQESRDELLSRVSNLKKDLQDWRFKLDNQVKSYRSELGDLRKTLDTEVSALRDEFKDLRATLRQQLEATAEIAGEEEEEEPEGER